MPAKTETITVVRKSDKTEFNMTVREDGVIVLTNDSGVEYVTKMTLENDYASKTTSTKTKEQ